MLYFAYGSNLNVPQMAIRCPKARPLSPMELPDWRLAFRGVADIEASDGDKVPGVLWRITPDCERALDRYEGVKAGFYSKEYFTIGLKKGKGPRTPERVLVYIMNRADSYGMPSPGYYESIRAGYQHFKLDKAELACAVDRAYEAIRVGGRRAGTPLTAGNFHR